MTSSFGRFTGCFAICTLLGCGGGSLAPAPRTGSAEPPKDRLSVTRPTLALAFRSVAFDYVGLPELEPMALPGELGGASFAFVEGGKSFNPPSKLAQAKPIQAAPGSGEFSLEMAGDLVVEIEIGNVRVFRAAESGKASAHTPVSGIGALCGHEGASTRAVWQGYAPHGSPSGELTYVCYEGPFDPHACRAKASRAWRVAAPKLAVGGVFAFRAKDGACSPVSRLLVGHEERLEVVGPRALWLGSSDPHSIHREEIDGSFSRLTIPVWPGGAGSAVLDVIGSEIRTPGEVLGAPNGTSVFSYSFEVVWPERETAPSATAFVSGLSGDAQSMAAPPVQQNVQYELTDDDLEPAVSGR